MPEQRCEPASRSAAAVFPFSKASSRGLTSSILHPCTGTAQENYRSYGLPVLRLQVTGTTEMTARRGLRRYESFVARDNLTIYPGDWELSDIRWKLQRAEAILVVLDPAQLSAG